MRPRAWCVVSLIQYFSTGTSFYEHSEGAYRMVKADRRQKIVVVASEPLTFEKGMFLLLTISRLDGDRVEYDFVHYP